MEDVNQAIRLKSLVFWLDKVKGADARAFVHKLWIEKDYGKFLRMFPVCPFCNGAPVLDLKADDNDVFVNGMLVDRVMCYCASLKLLCEGTPRWFESPYSALSLDALMAVDVPSNPKTPTGKTANRTREIIEKLQRFTWNPTRSALILGGVGSGKTHMLQSIKTSLGGFAVYITMSDLFSKIMDYVSLKDGELNEFIEILKNSAVLLMDDFGLEHETKFGADVIAGIVDFRYSLGRYAPTIMTTNLTIDEIKATPGVVRNKHRILDRMTDEQVSSTLVSLQASMRDKLNRKAAGL